MSALTTLAAEIEKFTVAQGPTIDSDPPSGWPDKDETPIDSIVGITAAGGSSSVVNIVGALTPGELVGGTFSLATDGNVPGGTPAPAGSYGDGLEVAANTATQVSLASPLSDGAGSQSVDVAAVEADQRLFYVGVTSVGLVTEVKNVDTGGLLAVDPSDGDHDPSAGLIAVGEDPLGPVSDGDVVRFTFRRELTGGPPAGRGWRATRPRTTAPADFTTGEAWATAYEAMFLQGSPPPLPAAVASSGAKDACRATIEGLMAVPGMAPVALTSGFLAYWGAISASAGAIWPLTPPSTLSVVPPPGIFAVGLAVLAAMAPGILVPPPTEPFSAFQARAQADALLMATAIHVASQGAQIISQPGASPVPVPFVLT
ncbi:MAG TPA: hypothetical protein VM285_04795 [Polyangia bacterium]|nr:hypothetical protein [Polyangia bacterium]